MGICCLYFNEVLVLIKYILELSDNTAIQQYANNNLSSIHTENLLTELCLTPLVIVVSTGGNENMGFVD